MHMLPACVPGIAGRPHSCAHIETHTSLLSPHLAMNLNAGDARRLVFSPGPFAGAHPMSKSPEKGPGLKNSIQKRKKKLQSWPVRVPWSMWRSNSCLLLRRARFRIVWANTRQWECGSKCFGYANAQFDLHYVDIVICDCSLVRCTVPGSVGTSCWGCF